MSRELKFRAWDKKNKKMTNSPYLADGYIGDYTVCLNNGITYMSEDYIFMQYTGLHDKLGKEIYEGDILDFDDNEWGCDYRSAVSWDEKQGKWDWGGGTTNDLATWRAVIGNIYENPLLLEAKS